MKIPWGLVPMTAKIAQAQTARVEDFQERDIPLEEAFAELAKQIEDVTGVLSKLELRLGLLEGAIEQELEGGVIYLHSVTHPESGRFPVEQGDIITDDSGKLWLRF